MNHALDPAETQHTHPGFKLYVKLACFIFTDFLQSQAFY